MTSDPLDKWPSSEQLRELFPRPVALYTPRDQGKPLSPSMAQHNNRRLEHHKRPLKTRTRMILLMEMRGFTHKEIAVQLGISPHSIYRAVHTDRYIEAREMLLGRMDAEFSAMKPNAFAALSQGLRSKDENTALRASEAWMKAAGFGQYGKGNQSQGLTAEDVARQLLQVNVNIVNQSKE